MIWRNGNISLTTFRFSFMTYCEEQLKFERRSTTIPSYRDASGAVLLCFIGLQHIGRDIAHCNELCNDIVVVGGFSYC